MLGGAACVALGRRELVLGNVIRAQGAECALLLCASLRPNAHCLHTPTPPYPTQPRPSASMACRFRPYSKSLYRRTPPPLCPMP